MGIRIRGLICLLRVWSIHSIQKSLFFVSGIEKPQVFDVQNCQLIRKIPEEASKLTCSTCLNTTHSSSEDGIKIFILQVAVVVLIILKFEASGEVTESLIMEILEGIGDILKRSISATLFKCPE